MKKNLIVVVLAFIFSPLFSQVGGKHLYNFLNLPTSARISALGDNQIAVKDDDAFLGFINPSLLNSEMDNKMAFTYVNYLADVTIGFASYTKDYDSLGTFNFGIQYVDYGNFLETDEAGNELGNFNAGEYAFVLGYGYQIDTNFSFGANLKTIYSSFCDASSVGLAADIAFTYFSEHKGLTMALLAKNMGAQLSNYTESQQNESLPFEIQFGLTKRFKNVPLRLGIIFHQLQNWNLTYEDPVPQSQQTIFGSEPDQIKNNNQFLENLARHLIVNAEFLVTKNFNLRFGYNYLRRAELKVDENLGSIGFSWGFGMRISKFHLSYGRSAFHQAGANNTFSVSTRLSDFIN